MRKPLSTFGILLFGVLSCVCLTILAFYLETVEYTAQVPASSLQELRGDRVKVDGIWVEGVERVERKGDCFELTIDRYGDPLKALAVIVGVIALMISLGIYID